MCLDHYKLKLCDTTQCSCLGAFLKLGKATVSFVMFVCLSVCLYICLSVCLSLCLYDCLFVGSHGTTRLPLNEFS
jgi:hypothetical protein